MKTSSEFESVQSRKDIGLLSESVSVGPGLKIYNRLNS